MIFNTILNVKAIIKIGIIANRISKCRKQYTHIPGGLKLSLHVVANKEKKTGTI